jgi:hypothetical protein
LVKKYTGFCNSPIGGKVSNRRGLRTGPLLNNHQLLNLNSSSNHHNPFHHEAPISITPLLRRLCHPPPQLLRPSPPHPQMSSHLLTQTSNRPTDNSIRPTPQSPSPQRRTCRFSSSSTEETSRTIETGTGFESRSCGDGRWEREDEEVLEGCSCSAC